VGFFKKFTGGSNLSYIRESLLKVHLFKLLSGNFTRLFKKLSSNNLIAIEFIGISSGLKLKFIKGDNLSYIRDGSYKLYLNKGSVLLSNCNSSAI